MSSAQRSPSSSRGKRSSAPRPGFSRQPLEAVTVAREAGSGSEVGGVGAPPADAGAGGREGGVAPPAPKAPLGTTSELMRDHSLTSGNAESEMSELGYRGLGVGERRRVRFGARALLWDASTLKAVRCCGRLIHGETGSSNAAGLGVLVRLSGTPGAGAVAGFGNLTTCGSVWACPRCSAVIAAERAVQIGRAVAACTAAGGSAYLVTLTLRHTAADSLEAVWDGLASAWRSLVGSHAWTGAAERVRKRDGSIIPAVRGDADLFDVAGIVRAVEATHGPSGWHLHIHAIMFARSAFGSTITDGWRALLCQFGFSASTWDEACREWFGRCFMASRCYDRWLKGLSRRGFDCGGVGVDVRRITDHGAEFIGRYLAKATYDAAHEVAAGATMKGARAQSNSTPFELLYRLSMGDERAFSVATPRRWHLFQEARRWYLVDDDTARCREVYPPAGWRLWWEWEGASKGRRQIVWSRRVADAKFASRQEFWNDLLDARGVDRADEVVASDDFGGQTLGEIARSSWYRGMVYRPSWLAEALEAAEAGGRDGVAAWMTAHDIDFQIVTNP